MKDTKTLQKPENCFKRFEILGVPIPLKRHRSVGKIFYDPHKKEKEKFAFDLKLKRSYDKPYDKPIKVKLTYHMLIPQSYREKKKKEMEGKIHVGKPDLSNLIKFTEDALNKILWEDDSLIYSLSAEKVYSFCPKTIIEIDFK